MNKLLLATAIAGASAITITPEHMQAFTDFTTKYEKTYADDAERANRLGVFTENFEKLTHQNRDHLLLGGEAVFGITKFMDLTPAEFKSTYLTYIPRNESTVKRTDVVADGELADSVDWRTKGAVTPVKDQGQCGACWAISATEAIESYAFLAGQKLQELSAQQITSCDKTDYGCDGGEVETAYEYVVQNGGIATEEAYPFTSGNGTKGRCKSKTKTSAVTIKSYTSVKKGEKNLKTALNNGPVSVCLAADSFQSYTRGIIKSCPGEIDHCVQAVGYSTEGNYWIVRNSWNTNWGEDGFIRVKMGNDLCHIADDVTFPTF